MNEDLLKNVLASIYDLLLEKDRNYGSTYNIVPSILKLYFPDGIPVSSYDNLLLIIRTIEKLGRLSTNKIEDKEDPIFDIAGYCILSLANDEK